MRVMLASALALTCSYDSAHNYIPGCSIKGMTQTELLNLLAASATSDVAFDNDAYADWSTIAQNGDGYLEIGDGKGCTAQVDMTADQLLGFARAVIASHAASNR